MKILLQYFLFISQVCTLASPGEVPGIGGSVATAIAEEEKNFKSMPVSRVIGKSVAFVSWIVLASGNPTMVSPENPRGMLGASSTFCSLVFGLSNMAALENIIPSLLGGVATAFFFPTIPTPDEVYRKIWGNVEAQVNDAVIAKSNAILTQSLITLTQNLNQQITGYLAELQLSDQTPGSLLNLVRDSGGFLNSTSDAVDLSMKSIDTILASSFDWFSTLNVNMTHPTAFILARTGDNSCLHTREGNLQNGTDLIMDSKCDLSNLADKMFSVGTNNMLLLRTINGLKCVAYNSNNGDDVTKHLAIFDINTPQCQNGRLISIGRARNGGMALFDGFNELCVGDGKSEMKANAVITSAFKPDSISSRFSFERCLGGKTLVFDSRIPIPLVDSHAGGADQKMGTISDLNITPARSFQEMSVQLFYFPRIASIHLMALKELHAHGSLKRHAAAQFKIKLSQYQEWLQVVVPIVTVYSKVLKIDVAVPLRDASVLLRSLSNATLAIHPITWTLENKST